METFIVFFKRALSIAEFSRLIELLVAKRFFDYQDINAQDEDETDIAIAGPQELASYLDSTEKPVLEVIVDQEDMSWHAKKLWVIQEKEFHDKSVAQYGYGLMFVGWKFMRTCMLFSVEEYPELEFVRGVAKQSCFGELLSVLEEAAGSKLEINYGEE